MSSLNTVVAGLLSREKMQEEDRQSNPFRPPESHWQETDFVPSPRWDKSVFSLYGRMKRSEFWKLCIIGGITVYSICGVAAIGGDIFDDAFDSTIGFGVAVVTIGVTFLFWTWFLFAQCVKRLHDRNKSGALIATIFIPIVGFIWLWFECGCMPGTDGPNDYGPEPP